MNKLLLTRVLIALPISFLVIPVLLYVLWMKSGLDPILLLIVSAVLIYLDLVIACILGEHIFRRLNKKRSPDGSSRRI
jgi:hypothetical protein